MSNNKYESVSNIQQSTNQRIYDRNIPSQLIQPYLDVRPVMTKYSIMPIVDPRKTNNVNMVQTPTYNIENVFNPGNTKSPWSGYASQVNKESELRNQIYALQRCSQSVYVPNSNSDLYNNNFKPQQINNELNIYSTLFNEERFDSFNPNTENVGNELFYNYTREQNRSSGDNRQKKNCNL
jgi:hypothetical protein